MSGSLDAMATNKTAFPGGLLVSQASRFVFLASSFGMGPEHRAIGP